MVFSENLLCIKVDNWVLDERMKRMIMDLQRHWLTDYQQSREKLLVEMTEKVALLRNSM